MSTQNPVGDQQIARNKHIHDGIATKYDRQHTEIFNEHEQARLANSLARAIATVTSATEKVQALDIGCGSGNLTSHLLELGCDVTAADVSARFLELVRKRFKTGDLSTSQLNGTDLSQFSDASFDLVATYSVLHHVPDYLTTVREMGRVCRPGGVVYIDHEPAEHRWTPDPIYVEFQRRAKRPNLRKWFKWINYYGKVRRLFDPRFANEGDIHVWPDDHIEWDKIADALGSEFEVEIDDTYLLYDGLYRAAVYQEYVGRLTDTRVMGFRRKV